MVTQALIGIPGTSQSLDATAVTTSLGTGLREAVFIADPTNTNARAAVNSSANNPSGYGLLTRNMDLSVDAFNRLRVSSPRAELSGFNEYKLNPFNYVTSTSGTGTVTHSTTTKLVTLAAGGTANGALAILQSRAYLRYNPGNSLLIKQTFVMGSQPGANAVKRAGYFDDNNGFYLQWSATGVSFIRRSSTTGSVVETAVAQANWNVDPLNGTGASGLTLDLTMGQILVIDLQFLGVGTVRMGVEINGLLYWAHFWHHANVTAVQPYIATANLPVRWEVRNTGVAANSEAMQCVCGSVLEEGALEPKGQQFSMSNGAAGVALTTTLKPLLSIRPGPTFNGIINRGWMIPDSTDLFLQGTNDAYYQIIWNATLTGAAWTAVNATYAMAQYDVTASAVALGNGIVLEDGYVSAGSGKTGGTLADAIIDRPLVNSFDGTTPDTLTVAMRTISGTGTGYAAYTWTGYW